MDFVNVKWITYRSYLLRLWCDEEGQLCRASLQSTSDKKVYHFGNIEALFLFLTKQVKSDSKREDDQL
jgi:hypothetical protein